MDAEQELIQNIIKEMEAEIQHQIEKAYAKKLTDRRYARNEEVFEGRQRWLHESKVKYENYDESQRSGQKSLYKDDACVLLSFALMC